MFVGVVVENFHKCRESQEKEEKARRAAKRAKKMEKKRRSTSLDNLVDDAESGVPLGTNRCQHNKAVHSSRVQ